MPEVAGKVGGGDAEGTRGQRRATPAPMHKTEGEAAIPKNWLRALGLVSLLDEIRRFANLR